MGNISKINNGKQYQVKDTIARSMANPPTVGSIAGDILSKNDENGSKWIHQSDITAGKVSHSLKIGGTYYDGSEDAEASNVSGTSSGNAWIKLKINGEEHDLPQGGGSGSDPNAVNYTTDTGRTESEKSRARSNIGAASSNHNHDSKYAVINHNHSEYAVSDHTHSNYALTDHNHDDRYYTESEIDEQMETKSSVSGIATGSNWSSITINGEEHAIPTPGSGEDTNAVHYSSESKTDAQKSVARANIDAAVSNHNHDAVYAGIDHNHDAEYASSSHNHNGTYALILHSHDDTYSAIDHNHDSVYSSIGHIHSSYALTTHNHNSVYSPLNHNHDTVYAGIGHNHTGTYAPASHNHDDRYYTESEIDTQMSSKASSTHNHDSTYAVINHNHTGTYAPASHNHDDRYYTESEIDTQMSGKASSTHNHTGTYAPVGHNHDSSYATINHNHTGTYAPASHNHDGRYYTEAEIDTQMATKSSVSGTYSGSNWTSITINNETHNIPTPGSGEDTNAVHYSSESKTDAQKSIARTNIGAAASNHNHTGTYSPVSHTHSATDITDGTFDANMINIGTGLWDDSGVLTIDDDVVQLKQYAVHLNDAQTISGLKTFTHGLVVSGRTQSSGDDEGIVIGAANNGYAGLCLGNPSGERVVLYNILNTHTAQLRHNLDGSTSYSINMPNENGTFATREWINNRGFATETWCWENFIPWTCLIEGTKIKMFDGTEKNIEDIKSGDSILTYDLKSNTNIEGVVIGASCTGSTTDYDAYIFENGTYVESFGDHSIFDVETNCLKQNSKWTLGEHCLSSDIQPQALVSVDTVHHPIYKRHYVIITNNNLYYANGLLLGHWSATKYNYIIQRMSHMNFPSELIEQYRKESLWNDKRHSFAISPENLEQSGTILANLRSLTKQSEDLKQALNQSDYTVTKVAEAFFGKLQAMKLWTIGNLKDAFDAIKDFDYTDRDATRKKIEALEPQIASAKEAYAAVKRTAFSGLKKPRSYFRHSSNLGNKHVDRIKEWANSLKEENEA